jgi:iron(III) transport system substrate-binding protein
MTVLRWLLVGIAVVLGLSCKKQPEVVLYTSVDEPYLRQMVKRFELASGVKVVLVTDGEAAKTTGLAERILAEKDRPRADVYWGNEPFHTIRLAEAGLLERYVPPGAGEIPSRYRDPDGRWTGVGFRARMIAVSARRELAALTANLSGVEGLVHPSLRNRIAMASPATGTTSGHLAALYVVWGEERYRAWLLGLRQNNVRIVGGNAVVSNLVGDGTMLAGLTDNDDISATLRAGGVLRGLLPDQTLSPEDAERSGTTRPTDSETSAPPGMGTLLVPTTVALVANSPNPDQGRRLIDFITDRRMEEQLFADRFLYGTLRDLEKTGVRGLAVDLNEVSKQMRRATEIALTILQDRPAP